MPTVRNTTTGHADQTATPTAAGQWKKGGGDRTEEGFIAELPSGNVVRMTRTLDMPILLKTGQIPNPLAGIVQRMIDTRTTAFPEEEQDAKLLGQLLDLLNETAVRAVIEPPFDMPEKRGKTETPEAYQDRLSEWEPKEGCISIWDLELNDKFFIFAVAQGAAADLASFRTEQERVVAGIQAGDGVRDEAKRTGGAKSKK